MTRALQIDSKDGYTLGGELFPADDADTALIVLGATAVPCRFYRSIASSFQARGWDVVTFDYRGIGLSKPPRLRGFDATMTDWALKDLPAALAWIHGELKPRRLFAIAHSFGGQVTGLLEDPGQIDAMVTVSSQSGYWGVQGGREKLRARILVQTVLPWMSHLLGYFPWSRLARGEDLPAGVALQWSRWCRQRRYLLDDETLPLDRFAGFTAPILAYSVDDDDWGTARSVDEMMSAYPNVERRHLVPSEHGIRTLGHMGYFRDSSAALWDTAFEWFKAKTNAQAAPA